MIPCVTISELKANVRYSFLLGYKKKIKKLTFIKLLPLKGHQDHIYRVSNKNSKILTSSKLILFARKLTFQRENIHEVFLNV